MASLEEKAGEKISKIWRGKEKQPMNKIKLREATQVEITALVDNYSDFFLADSERVKRLRVVPPSGPLAEPGLSFLIKVYAGSEEHSVLFDGGLSATCLLHNLQMLASSRAVLMGEIGPDITKIESVVLSHGHFDHFGGLPGFLGDAPKPLSVILHPEAFVPRRFQMGPQQFFDMPGLTEEDLTASGTIVKKFQKSSTLASDLILVSGQVERQTDFEQGMPGMEAKMGDQWVPDPFHDDQGLAVNLKDKGLVIIGGCSHAGIINTARYLQKTADVEKIHAVLGGFHLTGDNEKIIDPTVEKMKALNPDYIVPMHCTGWKAIHRFAQEMPEKFILNSVGSTYIF
jgi:7,8-dihydropterin-6-yl-methyl-4-(beta-D-ribofuranosyl)aminobenzene 5'-phosphate synthase